MDAERGTIASGHRGARQFGADDWRLALLVIVVMAVATTARSFGGWLTVLLPPRFQ